MTVIGIVAIGYGGATGSVLMVAEGLFLLWLSVKITLHFITSETHP